jgi:hypothetical protein
MVQESTKIVQEAQDKFNKSYLSALKEEVSRLESQTPKVEEVAIPVKDPILESFKKHEVEVDLKHFSGNQRWATIVKETIKKKPSTLEVLQRLKEQQENTEQQKDIENTIDKLMGVSNPLDNLAEDSKKSNGES